MIKKESMSHHAFLFVGPDFVGKFSVARKMAEALVSGQKEIDWQNENQKVSGDIIIIEPIQEENSKGIVKQKDISVSQVREAIRLFHLSADGKAKVLIVKNAHKMTTEAQNALLKTLEEPPKNAFLILVASDSSSLLNTIISRCFKITFNLVENEDLQILTQDENLLNNAMGRPELLQKMLENVDFNDWVNFAVEKLRNLAKMSVSEKIDLAEFLSKKNRADLDIFLQIWVFRIRKVALERKNFKLLKVASKVENVFHEIHFSNVNLRLILEEMFFSVS
jgi:DNA polymerase-3 subunit delta'